MYIPLGQLTSGILEAAQVVFDQLIHHVPVLPSNRAFTPIFGARGFPESNQLTY